MGRLRAYVLIASVFDPKSDVYGIGFIVEDGARGE